MADLYNKVLRIRVTEAQYSAMALQAAAEGHSGISNWARSQLVRSLGEVSRSPVVAPGSSSVGSDLVVVVEPDTHRGSQRPSEGAPLITDDEMKAILDDVLQGKG